jgi:hypothetical protein
VILNAQCRPLYWPYRASLKWSRAFSSSAHCGSAGWRTVDIGRIKRGEWRD